MICKIEFLEVSSPHAVRKSKGDPLLETDFFQQANEFLQRHFERLDANRIQFEKNWNIDHICYRVVTIESYQELKASFQAFSDLLIESEVNGRLISTFKLHRPLRIRDWSIDVLELPAPKVGKVTVQGFEHIEVVCDVSFDEIKRRFPGARYDESGLNKDFNPELEIEVDQGAVKFHHISLESVVKLESQREVFSALKQLNILKELKTYGPAVVGTFPLGLAMEFSDVDILISSGSLDTIRSKLHQLYGTEKEFKIEDDEVMSQRAITCSFIFEKILFEVFVQETVAYAQSAFLHFNVEERLLKLGGAEFVSRVKEHRRAGLKTEPAFMKALGLDFEPYSHMLRLQKASEEELRQILCPSQTA